MNISNITFQVLSLSNFVLNKCSEIIIFTIVFVVKSLKQNRCNNFKFFFVAPNLLLATIFFGHAPQ